MHYVYGDCSGKGKALDLSEAHLLWKRSKPSRYPTRYNLTRFAITMNELTPGLKVRDAICSTPPSVLFYKYKYSFFFPLFFHGP